MGWKKKASHEGAVKAVKSKYTAEQMNNGKISFAALEELFTPNDKEIYYNYNTIRAHLLFFFLADTNFDGNVELHELMNILDPIADAMKIEDKDKPKLKEYFQQVFGYSDVSKDKKCSLAEWLIIGFFALDANNGFKIWAEGGEDE